jgi:hypothetical protein
MRLECTRHALTRFRDRVIGPQADRKRAKSELTSCLMSAKSKDLAAAKLGKNCFVALGCCLLVCEDRKIVTVLDKLRTDELPRVQQTKEIIHPKPYTCEKCGKTVWGKKFLLRHVEADHLQALNER